MVIFLLLKGKEVQSTSMLSQPVPLPFFPETEEFVRLQSASLVGQSQLLFFKKQLWTQEGRPSSEIDSYLAMTKLEANF